MQSKEKHRRIGLRMRGTSSGISPLDPHDDYKLPLFKCRADLIGCL